MSTPDSVHLAPGALRCQWPDGRRIGIGAARLRRACRCATCRAAVARGEAVTGRATALAGAEPVGEYGLRLRFADGHDRGIYPRAYLLELGGSLGDAP
jgi:DUF971 family protein